MKAQLRQVEANGVVYPVLAFCCPGCAAMHSNSGLHMLAVNTDLKKPAWKWDGNLEAPTLEPSILTQSGNAGGETRCHSYLRGGVFEYLDDCTHELRGQHVAALDLPEWVVAEG